MSYFLEAELEALWERIATGEDRPMLLREALSAPLLAEGELLAILKAWSDAARRGTEPAARLIDKIDADALPRPSDATLDDCILRIEQRWPRDDWFAYLTNVQKFDGDLWERVVELVRPSIRRAGGLPPGGLRLELFFGRYRTTPSGIHLDSADNVAFVLRGTKRMIFWPRRCFEPRAVSADGGYHQALTARYRDHLAEAIVIDAQVGDALYWPRDFWHIGTESDDGGWSAMLALPFWWNASPRTSARFVMDALPALPPADDHPPRAFPCSLDALAAIASEVPDSLAASLQELQTNIDDNLELTARLLWAYFVTSYGFLVPPALAPCPAISEHTRLRVRHPIVALEVADTVVAVACGRLAEARAPDAMRVLGGLTVGTEFVVGERCEISAPAGGAPDPWLELVRALVSFRALVLA